MMGGKGTVPSPFLGGPSSVWDLNAEKCTGSSDGGPFAYPDPTRHLPGGLLPLANRCGKLENHCAGRQLQEESQDLQLLG